MGDISKEELDKMLKDAAVLGAAECLDKMGITEDNIFELREAMAIFRAVKKGLLQGISKLIMMVVLAVVLGAGAYWGLGK